MTSERDTRPRSIRRAAWPERWRRRAVGALVLAFAACERSPTSPAQNGTPAVTVAFQGASTCTPQPATPCTLEVVAQATDPDGDPLRYGWSGCATGTSPRATCVVGRPGAVVALVEVNDDHGHAVTAYVSGEGTNHPPGVQIGAFWVSPDGGSVEAYGNVNDPDEGFLCGRQYCVSAAASGACGSATLECTCLAGLEARVLRTAASGTCALTFSLRDSWGELGTPSITFDVANPRVLGVPGSVTSMTAPSQPGDR